MPLPATYAQATLYVRIESYLAMNILWYAPDGDEFGQSLAQDFAAAVDAKFRDPYRDVLSQEAEFDGAAVLLVNSLDRWTANSGNNPVAGNLVGSPLPNQDAAVIVKHIGFLNGRASRGRMFVPGCPENQVTDNNWVPAQLAALQVLANAVDDVITIAGIGFTPAVVSDPPGTFRIVTSCDVTPGVRTMRRRRPRS